MDATPNSTPSAASSASETNVSSAATDAKLQTPHGSNVPQETAAEKAARRYKLKVDGVEEEVDLDALDDASLVKELQMAKAARKRMQEAAEVRKSFKTFMEQLQKDPLSTLKAKELGGIDVRKMVEDQILREYEESQLPQEQRQLREMERKLQEREQQLQAIEDAQRQQAEAAFNARVEQETEAELMQALEASDLPKNRETLAILAQVAKLNLQHGLELTPQQLAAEAKARIQRMHGIVTKSLKGETLVKHLGDDVVKEILRYKLQSAKEQAQNSMKAPASFQQQMADIEAPDRPPRQPKDARAFRKFVKGL